MDHLNIGVVIININRIQELHESLIRLDYVLSSWLKSDQLPSSVSQAAQTIVDHFGNPPDLVVRTWTGGDGTSYQFLYFSSGVEEQLVLDGIATPLSRQGASPEVLTAGHRQTISTVRDAVEKLLDGKVLVGSDQWADWWAVDASGPPTRPVEEPENAKVIHGPHQGFIEPWQDNLYMLRQFVRTPMLRVEQFKTGAWVNRTIVLIWIQGLAEPAVRRLIRFRIHHFKSRGFVDSSRLAEALGSRGVFPTVQYSERPDQVAARLLSGRVALIVDQSPSVLLFPTTFFDLMNSPGDYYQLAVTGTITRLLRLLAFGIASSLPAIYVAALAVNQPFIPFDLFLTTVRSRLTMPFPAVLETSLLVAVVDMVQLAGMFSTGTMGQTVTIFGTLIIGDAAIKAGVVSAPTLITVALALLAQYLIPDANLANTVRIIRYVLIPPAAVFGLVGIVSVWVLGLGYLVRLKPYGWPYLTPVAPIRPGGWRDTIVRMPAWMHRWRR